MFILKFLLNFRKIWFESVTVLRLVCGFVSEYSFFYWLFIIIILVIFHYICIIFIVMIVMLDLANVVSLFYSISCSATHLSYISLFF